MATLFAALVILTALVHLFFVLFVVFGGLLVLRRPALAWLHVPAVAWGVWIEVSGGICPLTPLENLFRAKAGLAGYRGDFLEHYLFAALYPEGLTTGIQYVLGAGAAVINVAVYAVLLARRRKKSRFH